MELKQVKQVFPVKSMLMGVAIGIFMFIFSMTALVMYINYFAK
ncbi:MAG: hypothetical protein NTZ18_05020 [Candidatus Komeilibacteria bacterium]|nr:hypothetical protein [Candidatus Komeilibacteria bacterium]